MTEITRYTFEVQDQEELERDLSLAVFTAECLFGRPRVRLEFKYLISAAGERAVVEAKGAAGQAAVRVFTGLCASRVGESHFHVEQLAAESRHAR